MYKLNYKIQHLLYKNLFIVNKTDKLGTNFFKYIHPDDLDKAFQGIINVIQNPQKVLPIEFRCRHQQGSWLIIEAISQQFLDNSPEPRIIINSRDITERKRLDEMRLALEREKIYS